MNSPVIEILAPRYQLAWYPWAVQYFFLVALSYCSFWIAVPGLLLDRAEWRGTARFALLAAMTTAIVAPIALLADLHQPLRFWHFYAYFTTTSWMSMGSLMLPPYVLAIVALAWLAWREPMLAWRSRGDWRGTLARLVTLGGWHSHRAIVWGLGAVALVLSLGITLYTGSEIAIIKARSLWNTPWLIPVFITTGMIGAAGLILILNRFAGPRSDATVRQMLGLIAFSGVVTAIMAALWVFEGLFYADSSVAAAINSVRWDYEWRMSAFWGVTVGAILTLGALLALWRTNLRGIGWLMGLIGLHLAWMTRWVILMDVQTVQKQTAGFSQYVVGWHSNGWVGVIGTFGLWLALVMIIDILVPWRAALGGADTTPDHAPDLRAEGAASHG